MATSQVVASPTKAPSLGRQPKYYEADGALRAYANRSIVFAVLAGMIAVGALAGMIFVRIQPPTVIRVLPSGVAQVVSPNGTLKSSLSTGALQAVTADEAPTSFEKEAYVRTFLDRYLNYDAHTIASSWSYALNMMTGNLRSSAMTQFQKDDTVGRYETEHVRSVFKLSSIQVSPNDPLLYTAYGVREVHRMVGGGQSEVVDELVESYQIQLADSTRSEMNPTGLLIGSVNQTQISATTKTSTYTDPNQGEN
jgi:hypothetical protein